MLSGLLDAFLSAIMGPDTARNRKTRGLIPSQYLDPPDSKPLEPYDRIMRITQFLAEMTDTYAINTYRSIKGISLPVC